MKIAFVSFYNGLIERGAETWTIQLATRLISLGHQVTILQAGPSKSQAIPTIVVPASSILEFALKIYPIILRENYSIVIPTNGRWLAFVTRITTWIKGAKLLIVGHSGRGRDDMFNAWCFPDRFIALSAAAQKWIRGVNPFVKIEHIPVGVDVDLFTPTGKKTKVLLPGPIILVVAALEKNKQIDLTIQAVSKLNKGSLLILGSGEEQQTLLELGNKLIPGRFLITQVPFSKMPEYYRSAQIFTLCSWNRESYPAVYLEAMASGLAVVATDDPVRHEIVGNAGLFVSPGKESEYAHRLQETLDKDWGDTPRQQALKHDWDIIAGQFNQLLASL